MWRRILTERAQAAYDILSTCWTSIRERKERNLSTKTRVQKCRKLPLKMREMLQMWMSRNLIGYENVGGEDALLRIQLPFARRASGPKRKTAKTLAKADREITKLKAEKISIEVRFKSNWWKGKPSGSIACTRKQQPRFYWSRSSVVMNDATPLTPPSAWAVLHFQM